jgi:hypothetical protein
MKLKKMLDSLEGLTAEDKARYVEAKDGKFYLVGDANEGAVSALEAERKARRDAEAKAKAFDGIDIDRYNELVASAEAAEQKKLAEAGRWDEMKAKLVEENAAAKAQLIEAHAAEIKERDDKIAAMNSEINDGIISREILSVAASADAYKAEAVLDLLRRETIVEVDDDGNRSMRFTGKDGKTRMIKGEYMTAKDRIEEMKGGDLAFMFKGGTPGQGSGTTQGGGGGGQPLNSVQAASAAAAAMLNR